MSESPVKLNIKAAAQQEALTRPTLNGHDSGSSVRQQNLAEELKTSVQKEARALFDQGKISQEEFRKRLGLTNI